MKCNQVLENLPVYLNGELIGDEWTDLRRHLGTCKSCREELESMELFSRKVQEVLNYIAMGCNPSKDLLSVLQQRIASEKKKELALVPDKSMNTFDEFGFKKFRKILLPVATGLIAVAITLSVAFPRVIQNKNNLIARNIALDSQVVQTALKGQDIQKIGVVGGGTISKVVLAISPDEVIVADVDMELKEVIGVHPQKISDITESHVLEIVEADTRVQGLLNEGYSLFHYGTTLIYPTTFQDPDAIRFINKYGAEPDDVIGFLASMMLKINQNDASGYMVWANMSTEKIVSFGAFPGGVYSVVTITSKGETGTATAPPVMKFVTPDPGSIEGEKPAEANCSYRVLEQNSHRLVIGLFDDTANRRYCTFTWNVTDSDIQEALELANSDPQVQSLISRGAKIVSIKASYINGQTSKPTISSGIMWSASVRIDLENAAYLITADISSRRTLGFMRLAFKPDNSKFDIMIP
jgi:hypothetical protein